MAEHSIPTEPDDDADEVEPHKIGQQRRALDPGKGHSRNMPKDMSGQDATDRVYTGEIPPKLAGERAKALEVIDRVKSFVDKYSDFAISKLGGYKKGTLTSKPDGGEGRKGIDSKMSKDKVLKLIDNLAMMPQSKMLQASRALANYVWTVHARVRQELRKSAVSSAAKQGITKWDVNKSGEMTTGVDTEHPSYKDALAAASQEFETDSMQIKADLNLLASAAGALKRSGGGGGKADASYLAKRPQFGEPPKIVPQDSTVSLSKHPELQRMAGGAASDADKPAGKAAVRATGPTVRKGAAPAFKSAGQMNPTLSPEEKAALDAEYDEYEKTKGESLNRFMDVIIEQACADRVPKWWDEL